MTKIGQECQKLNNFECEKCEKLDVFECRK